MVYVVVDGYSLCLIFDKCLIMIEDEAEISRVLCMVVELGEFFWGFLRKVKKVCVLV